METDTQSFIEEESFDYNGGDDVESENLDLDGNDNVESKNFDYDGSDDVQDETSNDDFNFLPGFLPANEEMTKLGGSVEELLKQSQENSLILREVGVELLAQSIVLNALYKQNGKLDVGLKQVVETAIKNQPNPVVALEEPLKQIQEQARILIKARKPQSSETITSSNPFSQRAIALMLIAQTVIVATATTLTINYFPPRASVKTEQQWYSIFQRVDKLYKARFGNKLPSK